jgi:RNA polymerase sigma-70 factor, ECF subfamily
LGINAANDWQAIRNGDEKAFELMFKGHYQSLCNFACSFLGDMDEAEEIVQQVFYSLWAKRGSLDINTTLKAYLFKAVHNSSLNKIKQGKVRQLYANSYKATANVETHTSGQLLQGKELEGLINDAIAELPEQCGIVFKMSRFGNLKYAEIADELDISVKTVENHMGKALKLMRDKLKDYLHILIWVLLFNNQ